MTPAEKIIIKWHSANTFMFNKEDAKYYVRSLKDEVVLNIQKELSECKQYLSVQEIGQRFKYLRDNFVKADNKVNKKENLTYFEKYIYETMFFLKMYITHNIDHKEISKYESTSSIKVNESVIDASINERKAYFSNVKNNEVIKSKAAILNDIIK